jgi:hypothetical protein
LHGLGEGEKISQKVVDWQIALILLSFIQLYNLKIHKLPKNGKNHLTYPLNNCFKNVSKILTYL